MKYGISKKIVRLNFRGIKRFLIQIFNESKISNSQYRIFKEIEFYTRKFGFTFRYPSWTIKNHFDWIAENEMYVLEKMKRGQ